MLKHSRTVAAIAASTLLAAFAAQANKGAEYKPHHHKHEGPKFFITGGATYLEPSLNSLDYASTVSTLDPASSPEVNSYTVDPSFNWGYYIAAGYKISHHYDIQASWAQYNSSESNSVVGTNDGGVGYSLVTSNVFYLDPGLGESVTASSKQNVNYSVFDATLGQYHDITEMLKARVFAGVRWAKVDATIDNTYDAPFHVNAPLVYDNYSSSFNGTGPEVGLDVEYKVWDKLGVVGSLGAAFLIGNQEASSNVYNTDFQDTRFDNNQVNVNTDSVTRMVPALDAKLGLNWEIPYQHDRFAFAIEAGYQVAYYWDAVDQVQFTEGEDQVVHNYENYGNMGPYLNVTAMF